MSGGGGLGRFIVEKAGEFGVLHDDSGFALDGIEIFFLESVAGFGGDKHFAGDGDGGVGLLGSDGLLGVEGFIDGDDELRNIVEPGELGVVDDETEKFATETAPCSRS